MLLPPTAPPEASAPRRLLVQGLVVFLLSALLAAVVVDRSEHYRLLEVRSRASTLALTHIRNLEQQLHQALTATFALAALVRQGEGRIQDFTGTAMQMLPYYPGVGALQLAPDGVIRDIVPLAGNEGAIGHDLLKDPKRTREAFLARDTGKLTLAGPFNLIQGGLGAVGRMPIYLQSRGQPHFWGFATALIRFPDVLVAAGLPTMTTAGYDYVLWRIHPDTGERQVIAASGPRQIADPVEHQVTVPNGHWTLSVAPSGGWTDRAELAGKLALAALITALLSFSVILLTRQPALLRREVELRTRELREREAMLESLNELASDWIWTQDADFRFTWFSPGMARILDTDPAHLLGRRRWESPNTLSAGEWDAHRRQLEAHESFRDFEYGIVFPDGSVRYISASGQPVFAADGRFAGYRGTGKSITERKRAERALAESEARFQSLFEKAPVALSVTTEADGFRATRWNQTWLTLFGYAPEAVQGKSGNDIGLWVDPAMRDYYIGAVVEFGGASGIEASMRCADGRLRRIAISGRFIEAEGHRLLVTFYDDVTEARLNERAIRELNATLETRIGERTHELTEALEQLRRAQDDLVRSEKLASLGALVAGVAHELNTPIGNCLTVASAFADRTQEFARRSESGLRRSELADYLNAAEQASDLLAKNMHRAHELVSTFKQVAVDQASEHRRRFELATLVGDVAAMLQPTLRKTPWQLRVEVAPDIALDSYPGPLGQVLTNLIDNAVMHAFVARDHGTITVRARRNEDVAVIEVADDGVGMSDEVRQRAFDPFFTTRLGSGGTGLGLHIAFNIVTGILGGSIALDSAPGAGCRFVIRVPLQAPQRSPTAS